MVRVGGFDGLPIGSVAETAAMSVCAYSPISARARNCSSGLTPPPRSASRAKFVPVLQRHAVFPRLRSIVAHWLERCA